MLIILISLNLKFCSNFAEIWFPEKECLFEEKKLSTFFVLDVSVLAVPFYPSFLGSENIKSCCKELRLLVLIPV